MDDNLLDEILMYKRYFDSEVHKATSNAFSKHKRMFPAEWSLKCRREYLQTISEDITFDLLIENCRMEKYFDERNELGIRLCRGRIKEMSNQLDKIEKEMFYTMNPREDNYERVRLAKEVPFPEIWDFNKFGQAVCPFHADKDPSMKYYPKSNTVHCFSCARTWDTIQFVRELDNLSFSEAVAKCLANI